MNPSIVIPSAFNVITSPLPPPSTMQLAEPFSDFIVGRIPQKDASPVVRDAVIGDLIRV